MAFYKFILFFSTIWIQSLLLNLQKYLSFLSSQIENQSSYSILALKWCQDQYKRSFNILFWQIFQAIVVLKDSISFMSTLKSLSSSVHIKLSLFYHLQSKQTYFGSIGTPLRSFFFLIHHFSENHHHYHIYFNLIQFLVGKYIVLIQSLLDLVMHLSSLFSFIESSNDHYEVY